MKCINNTASSLLIADSQVKEACGIESILSSVEPCSQSVSQIGYHLIQLTGDAPLLVPLVAAGEPFSPEEGVVSVLVSVRAEAEGLVPAFVDFGAILTAPSSLKDPDRLGNRPIDIPSRPFWREVFFTICLMLFAMAFSFSPLSIHSGFEP